MERIQYVQNIECTGVRCVTFEWKVWDLGRGVECIYSNILLLVCDIGVGCMINVLGLGV